MMTFPIMIRSIRLSLEAVDPKLEHAARTLGAGRWDRLFNVTLPLASPGILVGAIVGGIFLMGICYRLSIPLLAFCGFFFMFTIPILNAASQAIWQAKQYHTALRRYLAVCRQYRHSQPAAVATLRRDFRLTHL